MAGMLNSGFFTGDTVSFEPKGSFKDRWSPVSDFNQAARNQGKYGSSDTMDKLKDYGMSKIHDTFPSRGEAKGSYEGSQSDSPNKDNP